MSDPITVVLSSKRRRRAQSVQKLNHLIPALGLLWAGLQALGEGEHGFGFVLGVCEIVSAAALIALTIRELRGGFKAHDPHHHHHSVDWVDIAAGAMLSVEAVEHWQVTNHVSRPAVLTAILTFALGLSHGRMQAFVSARRTLRVSDDGIVIPGRPFKVRKLDAAWGDVRSIEVGERWAVVSTRSGRQRKLDLFDVESEAPVRAALLHARDRLAAFEAPNTAE